MQKLGNWGFKYVGIQDRDLVLYPVLQVIPCLINTYYWKKFKGQGVGKIDIFLKN